MYRLYWSPGAASLAVHWMLLELGVPFDLERADIDSGRNRSPDYLQLNPQGRVPTLVVDGAPVAETAALLMLLAERHPRAGLAPALDSPDRAPWLEWMLYLANTLQPAFRLWFYPDDLPGADREAIRAAIEAGFDRIDARLAGRRFMIGEALTTVDLLATMLMRWSRNMPRPATAWPNIAGYLAAVRARPALREVHAREGLTDWIDG
ncbi:MAG TPA: glutathione S-transferase family protein [Caulobacter sp.]|nr:glutathione S-transferase family protein [Caulobacter sp.]